MCCIRRNAAQISLVTKPDEVTIMTDATMTIRQMCDAFDVTPRTLRFYESKELLFPIRQGQKRLFTKRDRARLTLILRGKRFGFSLEEIRQLLDLYHMDDQQQTQLARTVDVARDRLADMVRQRDELTEAIDDLQDQLKWGEKMVSSMNAPPKAAQ
jgi:DNA-binding transcriptional MerR regulator